MKRKNWMHAALAALMALPMLLTLGGCFFDHDDRDHHDRHEDRREHHDDHPDADVHVDIH